MNLPLQIDRPIERRYYTTKQAAEIVGVNAATIRYWLQEYELSYRKTDDGRWRIELESLEALKRIYSYRRFDRMSIEEVKKKLKQATI